MAHDIWRGSNVIKNWIIENGYRYTDFVALIEFRLRTSAYIGIFTTLTLSLWVKNTSYFNCEKKRFLLDTSLEFQNRVTFLFFQIIELFSIYLGIAWRNSTREIKWELSFGTRISNTNFRQHLKFISHYIINGTRIFKLHSLRPCTLYRHGYYAKWTVLHIQTIQYILCCNC